MQSFFERNKFILTKKVQSWGLLQPLLSVNVVGLFFLYHRVK